MRDGRNGKGREHSGEDQGRAPHPRVVADLVRTLGGEYVALILGAAGGPNGSGQPGRRRRPVDAASEAHEGEVVTAEGCVRGGLHKESSADRRPFAQAGRCETAPTERGKHSPPDDAQAPRAAQEADCQRVADRAVEPTQDLRAEHDLLRARGPASLQQRR